MSGTELPTVVTAEGLQPIAPADLRAMLVALVSATNPDYTANLPGSLIEDVASTDVGAMVLMDQARVETVNSLTPYGANAWLLKQLGAIYGVPTGTDSNTSVAVVFSGPPGYVVAQGFLVSDNTHQYAVQDGGIIEASGTTLPLSAVAAVEGSWAVAANTVTFLVTSVASTIGLTVTNPLAGAPGAGAETETNYRVRVLRAGLAASMGMARTLKTLLANISGVQTRLIAVRQVVGGGWEVICGGSGDPYQIAYAIFDALFDVSTLTGSVMEVTGITNANPGVITTALNHGYVTGQVCAVNGATGMTAINALPLTATVITEKTFSCGVNTTGYGTYTGNGVLTPNFRNASVVIDDYPDTYLIPFVLPPSQSVTMTVTWNTSSLNFVSDAAIAQLAAPALADYVNTVPVTAPLNLFQMQSAFEVAVASVLAPELLSRLVFTVSINGVGTVPDAGTGLFEGDPESYFVTTTADIIVSRG